MGLQDQILHFLQEKTIFLWAKPISISDFEGQNAELNPGEISKSDCSRFQS